MPLWQISALSLLSAYYTVMHNYWTSWQSRLNVFWGPWARRADGAPPPPFPSFPPLPSPLPTLSSPPLRSRPLKSS